MARRIALVGTAPSSVHAPFTDETWEIWGCSLRGAHVSRANRWYEIHRLEGESPEWAAEWRKEVRERITDAELIMFYPEPELAPGRVTQYPIPKIAARFGTFFMTSSFAWMYAQAIDELAPMVDGRPTLAEPGSEIGLWGCDMELGTEYREQRVGVRHFQELGKQLGINITKLNSSGIAFEPTPYPLIQDDPILCKLALRQQDTAKHLETLSKATIDAGKQIATVKGALGEVELIAAEPVEFEGEVHDWEPYDPEKRRKALRAQLKQLEEAEGSVTKHLIHYQAVDSEQKWLKDYLSP